MKRLATIDWQAVVAIDAYVFQNTKSPRRFFHLRKLAKLFLSQIEIDAQKRAEYLCFRSLERADYKELFESIVETVQSSKVIVQDFNSRRKYPNINVLLNLIRNIRIYPKLGSWPIKTRLYLYCRIAYYTAVIEKLSKLEFAKILVFADMQPLDNLVIQFFSDKTSITLQHGLYVDYEETETVNVANYKYQVANYFLAWGRDTASLIARYHPETIISICGKPNLIQNVERDLGCDQDYFSVVFDQPFFEKYNSSLLDIANQFSHQTGLRFNLRMHPWNDPLIYSLNHEYIVETKPLESSKFIIGHTTSMLYELLRIGVPAFKLKSLEYSLPTAEELQFGDMEELVKLSARNFSSEQCIGVGKEYISYIGEESLARYQNFFFVLDSTNYQNSGESNTSS